MEHHARKLPPCCQKNGCRAQGFTLIELSIVLVIVGLITGGILVGSHLIDAAKQRGLLSELEKLDVKVNVFRVKYGSLPGDIPSNRAAPFNFSTCGAAGSEINDGYIALAPGGSTRNCDYYSCTCESSIFGRNLLQAELIATGDIEVSGTPFGGMVFLLTESYDRAALVPYSWIGYGVPGNWLVVEGGRWHVGSQLSGNNQHSSPLSASAAKHLDGKIDDGKPLTGIVQMAAYVDNSTCHGLPFGSQNFFGTCLGEWRSQALLGGACGTSNDPATAEYKNGTNRNECKIGFKRSW